MAGLFRTRTWSDPQLGELKRSRGRWRGALGLGGETVPLVLSGPRRGPDPASLELARTAPRAYPAWRGAIASALIEHHEPSTHLAPGERDDLGIEAVRLDGPDDVWRHVTARFVHIITLDGLPAIEIGYEVAWDPEHTLGARIRDGRLVELSGSVLTP